jgi:hypothetical protein
LVGQRNDGNNPSAGCLIATEWRTLENSLEDRVVLMIVRARMAYDLSECQWHPQGELQRTTLGCICNEHVLLWELEMYAGNIDR